MYILNDKAKKLLMNFKFKWVAKTIGINPDTLSKMVKQDKTCMKLTAYCLTKLLNADAEIEDYFIRVEE